MYLEFSCLRPVSIPRLKIQASHPFYTYLVEDLLDVFIRFMLKHAKSKPELFINISMNPHPLNNNDRIRNILDTVSNMFLILEIIKIKRLPKR